MNQKELKELYTKELEGYWKDESMVKHCIKNANYIIKLDDNSMITIEKPTIKKDFCFGYHLSRYDSESYDNANRLVDKTSEDQDYFMQENLKNIKKAIENLTSRKYEIWILSHYTGQSETSKLRTWTFKNHWDDITYENSRKLTDEEIEKLIEGYKEVEKQFTKRLNTYLKKYGMTKVNTWSYWKDA